MALGLWTLPLAATGAALGLGWWFKRRGLDPRLLASLWQTSLRSPPALEQEIHVLLCVADHYEPKHGPAPMPVARARIEKWACDYPRNLGEFCDSDGRPPRHSFFYPLEEYEPEILDALAELCRQGYGEVEVHLHHDNDCADRLRRVLVDYKHLLAEQHGLLARRRESGELAYGFIHGNWALCNSHPEGDWCGVNEEIDVLRDTGCYADFTMPSAPHPTQTRTINRIYYATNRAGKSKSHDTGQDVGAGPAPMRSLMLIQGPLALNWRQRKWGLMPRLENGCLQASQPPSLQRLRSWLQAAVQVPTRPDWYFVKLHSHGAVERDHHTLLGAPMTNFHQALARHAHQYPHFHYHYVTAREMYNLAKAAEAGWQGSVAAVLDYELLWNGDCAARLQRSPYRIDLSTIGEASGAGSDALVEHMPARKPGE